MKKYAFEKAPIIPVDRNIKYVILMHRDKKPQDLVAPSFKEKREDRWHVCITISWTPRGVWCLSDDD